MSLSFVSSAVLSSSDGVSHNEERQIESKETKALRGQAKSHTPLFDQLRTNKEEEEAKREEFQRSIMRGTLALDEEDVAHLDSISRQKKERDDSIQASMEQELALFRAARADRNQSQLVAMDDEQQEENDKQKGEDDTKETAAVNAPPLSSQNAPSTSAPLMPKIVVKKKRRRRQQGDKADSDKAEKAQKKQKAEEPPVTTDSSSKQEAEESGLGGLLGGYGSSDSD